MGSRIIRKAGVFIRRRKLMPGIEFLTLLAFILIAAASYFILSGADGNTTILSPATAAILLVANLVPAIGLLVLFGRRVAKRRAATSLVGGSGRLHVRLVALFSMIASIPVLLVVVMASLLFQYGVEFWYSGRARSMFENAGVVAQSYYAERKQTVLRETSAMAGDLSYNLSQAPLESRAYSEAFATQVYQRELSEGVIFTVSPQGAVQSLVLVNPYERPTENLVPASVVSSLPISKDPIFWDSGDRIQAVLAFPDNPKFFLYASKVADPNTLAMAKRATAVVKSYDDLRKRSRNLQLQFNVALFAITLAIVGAAVLIALNVADRLVRPVGELVDAARRVAAGDLAARVPASSTRDEVGILSNAFNRMTGQLERQRHELVEANQQIDRRRAFSEAVLSSVTAGIVAVDHFGEVRLLNSSASHLLGCAREDVVGKPLGELSSELNDLLMTGQKEGQVEFISCGDLRTLAVKIVADEAGHVLTFDDITQQLSDQRRAAWADVARRIAHEIKNPLTPIQLAAERLKRRFSAEISSDPATFSKLTETIVRQVADLRGMVDEFSSFARMPKPSFQDEPILDIVRQSVFLHEVAHSSVKFSIEQDDPKVSMVCDRRQISQALMNIIKNGVEAIVEREDHESQTGEILVKVSSPSETTLTIVVSDNGVGLPTERNRLTEPYMTTRVRGTGLGLAIVKKIVEEHAGMIRFEDRIGGGTVVTLEFDTQRLATLGGDNDNTGEALVTAQTRDT